MHWSSTNNQKHTIERFELFDGTSPEMVLRYNPVQHSGRLERQHNQLLFFMEETGIRGNKFLFENEYGVEIGKISYDNPQNLDGHIQMDKKKISFKIPLNPEGDVFFVPNKFLNHNFHCTIETDHFSAVDKKLSTAHYEKYACMILGLFWFLFPESIPEANKSGVSLALH